MSDCIDEGVSIELSEDLDAIYIKDSQIVLYTRSDSVEVSVLLDKFAISKLLKLLEGFNDEPENN
jgi:hypothetical protein